MRNTNWAVPFGSLIVAAALTMASAALAQNTRGAATGPTTARGYDHADQFVHIQDVKPADNMYPVVPHAEQDRAARDKLAAQAQKAGKKLNIMIFLLDDVGWMDPGLTAAALRSAMKRQRSTSSPAKASC